MTRVVIDPGVLVSAFIFPRKAAPALIIDAVLDGKLDLIVSPVLVSGDPHLLEAASSHLQVLTRASSSTAWASSPQTDEAGRTDARPRAAASATEPVGEEIFSPGGRAPQLDSPIATKHS